MKDIIHDLNWRYATKKFDSSKKVNSEDLETLLEATRLSASSYGLQPYHIFVIENSELRAKLKPFTWNQSQITDASHVIVFANKNSFGEDLVDDYLENVVQTRGLTHEAVKGYSDFMKSKLLGLPNDLKNNWTARQAYLALGNLMTVAAAMKIDTCPIEGFENEKYNEILGLKESNLNASVVLAVGYRASNDETQHLPKVRYPKERLFTHL